MSALKCPRSSIMHVSQQRVLSPSMYGRHARLQRHARLRCVAGSDMTFQFGNTTLTFPFQQDSAQQLSGSIGGLLQTFQAKQKAERPKRWESMEYRFKGEPGTPGVELLEVFCNPNAYTTPFEARVMISLKTGSGIVFKAEESLTAVKSAVDAFLN